MVEMAEVADLMAIFNCISYTKKAQMEAYKKMALCAAGVTA
jgi:hypothetical protein